MKWSPGGRFLSYVKGGNAFGDADDFLDDYQLNVYDVVNQKERAIVEHPGLNWSWTNAGTLLYSPILPGQFGGVYERRLRPTTYEISAFGKNNKPLLDSGYFAQADPSNQWIAFCDWPGERIEAQKGKTAQSKEDEIEKGLYLYYRPAKRRVFVGALNLHELPLIQWAPDGKTLYVLDQTLQQDAAAILYRMDLEQQILHQIAVIKKTEMPAFFRLRGISADAKYLYIEDATIIGQEPGVVQTRRTFTAIETSTGQQFPLATMTNPGGDQDWDWHDDSGVNPAFVAAQKIENVLPASNAPSTETQR